MFLKLHDLKFTNLTMAGHKLISTSDLEHSHRSVPITWSLSVQNNQESVLCMCICRMVTPSVCRPAQPRRLFLTRHYLGMHLDRNRLQSSNYSCLQTRLKLGTRSGRSVVDPALRRSHSLKPTIENVRQSVAFQHLGLNKYGSDMT